MHYRTGLVVGKFMPPHEGHHYLIETAMSCCDVVVVAVLGRADDPIPVWRRVDWLREEYRRQPVEITGHYIPNGLADDDSAGWALFTREYITEEANCVFTSEDYGPIYAKHLGIDHVMVDREREKWPISASKIRSDPYEHWSYLRPGVRAGLCFRVAVVGADSIGKTTLSRALAKEIGTVWVPEYGRLYSEGKYTLNRVWKSEEFDHIANMQVVMENALARESEHGILICDTDVITTAAWHRRYMGYPSVTVDLMARAPDLHHDLYIIPSIDIPYADDGMREIQDPEGRYKLHVDINNRVEDTKKPRAFVFGTPEERLEQALKAIKKYQS